MVMPTLILYPGTPREMLRRFKGDHCRIGRNATNDIQIDQSEVSNRHAVFEFRDGHYWLRDLGSSNGSFVNGCEIAEIKLADGDLIRLGQSLEFRFSLEASDVVPPVESPRQTVVSGPVTSVLPDPLKTAIITPQVETPLNNPPPPTAGGDEVSVGPSSPTPPKVTGEPAVAGVDASSSQTGMMPFQQGMAMMPQGTVCPMCQTMIPFQVNYCPRCGNYVGARNLPMMAPQSMGAPLGPYVQPQESPGQGVGILPILAFLCGLSIIGFPFAIILGLVALSQIRKYGGFGSDRTQATWGVGLGVFWAMIFAVVIGYYATGNYREKLARQRLEEADRQAKVMAENESHVIDALKGIARAQKYARAIRAKDPNNTGVGRFLALDELGVLGTSLFNQRVADGVEYGFRFKIRDPNEAGYLAVAEPETYNVTGVRTFSIDATGLVRAQDLKGESHAQAGMVLPPVGGIKSAFEDMDDTIALEVIGYAKRLASDGHYELCGQLLDEVRANFTLTKAAQDLFALKGTIDPFIIEAQAETRYKKAQKAVADGDLKLAINYLKEIVENYPSYSKITAVIDEGAKHVMTLAGDLHKQAGAAAASGDLKKAISLLEEIRVTYPKYAAITNVAEQIGEHAATLAQQRDRQARDLFVRAEALEREGKADEAMDLYVQVETNFNDTEWAKHIATMKPALQKAIREKSAEELFTQVVNMADGGNHRDRLQAIEQLRRNYAQTEFVQRNAEAIAKHHQKVLADNYRAQAEQYLSQDKPLGALVMLEEAANNNPDMRPALRDLFARLYLAVGRKQMADHNHREALRMFRQYLALEPKQKEISPQLISQLSYQVAKTECQLGNYRESMQNLVAAQPSHSKDPEYLDLYGTVSYELGQYDEAIKLFNAAIQARPGSANFHARRGYASLIVALHIERETHEAIGKFLQQASVAPPPPPRSTRPESSEESGTRTGRVERVEDPEPRKAAPVEPRPQVEIPSSVFATTIPLPSTGTPYPAQIHYDPLAAQTLRNEVLDVIQAIRSTALAASPKKNGDTGADNDEKAERRLATLRTGVEIGNMVAALNQRVLDGVRRKKRSVQAMERMQLLFVSGNHDLAKAIELGADRSQELREILKVTLLHEAKIREGVPKIVNSINAEISVLTSALDSVENLHRTVQAGSINASSDPTPMLQSYFTKLFDRRAFAQGMQSLREAAELNVPMDLYTIRPLAISKSTAKPATTSPTPTPLPPLPPAVPAPEASATRP